MNIEQQRDAMNSSKRFQGNQVKDFYDFFPNVGGEKRQVILKTTDLVKEDYYIHNVHLPAKGYVRCDGRIATRLLNDFPQFIEAEASTLISHEGRLDTYYVEKSTRTDPIRKKKIPCYIPKLKYNEPIKFDMAILGLKTEDEIAEEIEAMKVQKELDKMRKELAPKLKAKKLLEEELNVTISDGEMTKLDAKTKSKKKGKK